MAAMTTVNYSLVSSSSLHPHRPSSISKPCFFKPLPSSLLSPVYKIKPISITSSPAFKIKSISITSSTAFAASSYCVRGNSFLPIKAKPSVETVIPSPISSILGILRTGVVAAVSVFLLASFSGQQPVLAALVLSNVNTESKDLQLFLSKLTDAKYAEANEILKQLEKMEPGAPAWQYFKGKMHILLQRDKESARSVFAELIRTDPLYSKGYFGLLLCASGSKELAEIKDMIDEAMKYAEGDNLREFKQVCAEYHIKAKEYDEAFKIYDELISEDPYIYLNKGYLHNRLTQTEEADKCFEKFLSMVPEDDPLYPRQFFANNIAKTRK